MSNQPMARGVKRKAELTFEQLIGEYFLNGRLSDVCFLVGKRREKFPAHRFLLATESEFFVAMFYGPARQTDYVILFPKDSSVGFRNMLK